MADLRKFTLDAREKLTTEAAESLLQIYGLEPDGRFVPPKQRPALSRVAGAMETRGRLEKLFADEQEAGLTPAEAHKKLVKEVAFTHLNRLVAFKLLEARKLSRGAVDRYHDSNGFKFYLASHDSDLKLFEQGSMPQDDLGEGPNDRAYRNFLLWQCGELAKEVKVLFDTDNLASRLFPRPRILRGLIDELNKEDLRDAWAPGNEETIGWVYQAFNSEELERAFSEARLTGKKFSRAEIPSVTQLFTPRLAVRFLVDNTLGRLWISMHPDSRMKESIKYLTPLPTDPPKASLKPVKEIRVLDPATGTMHFGLFAFDLFVRMYHEELENEGKPGWPEKSSVDKEEDIPRAIIANNIFGIDIDLRAVQLAALALYIRAKSTSKEAILTESNLASADVTIFRGQHLANIAKEMGLPPGVTHDLLQSFCESVTTAGMMGSLVRLEDHFKNFEANRLRKAIDDFVVNKSKQGVDESYFGNETSKGLRLLDLLARRYDVVFTNPPYISARKMNAEMAQFMKKEYPSAKGDLYAAFIQRCLELTTESGRIGMLTMHSFMFISSYEKLRDTIGQIAAIETLAHYGPSLFEVGNPGTLQTVALLLRREAFQATRANSQGTYFRLVKETDVEAKTTAFETALSRLNSGGFDSHVYKYRQGDFGAIPGGPWVYWITPNFRQLFVTLGNVAGLAKPKHGLSTCDNFRYLRFWWEMGVATVARGIANPEDAAKSGRKWFPYMKGGKSKRWFGNQSYVVNWAKDGEEIKSDIVERFPYLKGNWGMVVTNPDCYFRRGVTWSDLSSGRFSARLSPGGFIFDVKGSSAFPSDIPLLLGLLNSSFANYTLNVINPTVSYQVGDISRLPVPKDSTGQLRELVTSAIRLAQTNSEEDETTFDFIAPSDWVDGAETRRMRERTLADIERKIDDEIFRLYEIADPDRKIIEEELAEPAETNNGTSDPDETVERSQETSEDDDEAIPFKSEGAAEGWISYAVGLALGRFEPGTGGGIGSGRFTLETANMLCHLASKGGLAVLEEGHPDDLAARVIEILRTIYGDLEAERIIRTASGSAGALRDVVERYLLGAFFKEHVKRYRKRPIYWLFQSPKQYYSAYLFHERASDQTLALLQGRRYLGGRIHRLESELLDTKDKEVGTSGSERNRWKKKARDLAEELEDLKALDRNITTANNFPIKNAKGHQETVNWQPEFDDGVLLNAAPLCELTPFWKRADSGLDLKKAWTDLEKGEYNWAKTAMRYWPQQVLKACQESKSIAVAHGLL